MQDRLIEDVEKSSEDVRKLLKSLEGNRAQRRGQILDTLQEQQRRFQRELERRGRAR